MTTQTQGVVADNDVDGDLAKLMQTNDQSIPPSNSLSLAIHTVGTPIQPQHHLQIPICLVEGATRPSLDSFQSSSPSTAPPTTPTRMDDHLRECKFNLISTMNGDNDATTSSASPPESPITPLMRHHQHQLTLRERREVRVFDPRAATASSSSPTDVRLIPRRGSSGEGETKDHPESTLRRVGKRRARPRLGVTTFSPSTNPAVVLDSSPLSPVLASPRSQTHYVPQRANSEPHPHGSIPSSSSSGFFRSNRSPENSVEPTSPDIVWDLGGENQGKNVYLPAQGTPNSLMSPFGTSFIPIAEPTELPQTPRIEEEEKDGSQRLQYKPRKRVPTPRRLTTFNTVPTGDGGGSQIGVNELGALQGEKARRGSFSKWSFPTVNGGIGKSMMRRFSKLTIRTDVGPTDKAGAPRSAGDPRGGEEELRGYTSDGVKSSRRMSVAATLSRMLPSARRSQSVTGHSDTSQPWPSIQTPVQHRASLMAHGSSTSFHGHGHGGSSHGHGDTPLTRIGEHRMSTITVRSSDGWFSTVPTSIMGASNSLPPSPAFNQTTFGAQLGTGTGSGSGSAQDITMGRVGRSSSNPSKVSLPPPSAFVPPMPGSQTRLVDGIEGSKRHSAQSNNTLTSLPDGLSRSLPNANRPQSLLSSSPAEDSLLAPGSVRLLDVATAAALRKSIDFDDRVRKSESVLKSAIYGTELLNGHSGSRSSSFSGGGGKDSTSFSGSARGRMKSGRNSSLRGRRSSSVGMGSGGRELDRVDDGLDTGGGVFLPNAPYRPPPMRHMNRSYNSTSSSGYSTPSHVPFVPLSRSSLGQSLPQTSTTSMTPSAFGNSIGAVPEKTVVGMFHEKEAGGHRDKGALAHRLGRKISRIFVGKATPNA